jgi:signal transduction histidine kinase
LRFVGVLAMMTVLFGLTVAACTSMILLAGPFGLVGPPPGMAMMWSGARFIGPVVLVVSVIGLVALMVAAQRAAMPVGEVMSAAERVAEGDYGVRVREGGPREVRALARSFNAMTERLQRHNEQRRGLLADVTHELRTPLTVIQGNLEALIDGVYPADRQHLSLIHDETRVLSHLIDDLRTLSLAEAGQLRLQREPTDIAVLVAEAAAAFRLQVNAAQVTLDATTDPDLPLAEVDPTRLREVLANLIANALRYTPAGGHVRLHAQHQDDRFVIEVHDTGPGIAPERLAHVFDRFHKSDESRGMGLGLAIAKSLVDAHGGTLTATSTLGVGSTFVIAIPSGREPLGTA